MLYYWHEPPCLVQPGMGTASEPAGWRTGSDRIKQDYIYAIAVVSSLFAILFARYVAR